MNLIRIENRIYNFSLLIEAEFRAAEDVTGGIGAPFRRGARLDLRFASLQSEARTNHEGDYVGCEEVSPYCRILGGAEAESTWSTLNAMQRG